MSFSDKAIKYFCTLKVSGNKTGPVEIINPYESEIVKDVVKKFYTKYFNDSTKRLFVIGINPGRFGGGLTGISFTDPVALREFCGINNDLGERKELSSKFIYDVIENYGGVKDFYSNIFLTALYPFALIKNGKNYNYYDEKWLAESLRKEIIRALKSQMSFGARTDKVIILGKKNADYFSPINDEYRFFEKIITLEHPRYIMQYKLKKKDFYIGKYLEALT